MCSKKQGYYQSVDFKEFVYYADLIYGEEMDEKKPLKDFTKDEYKRLMATGMLWEFYPEATGIYTEDCEVMVNYEEYLDNVDKE